MSLFRYILPLLISLGTAAFISASENHKELEEALDKEILGPRQTMTEAQDYAADRVLPFPAFGSSAQWERYARRLREEILDRVIFRGEAGAWREARTQVEWLETVSGGPGYSIRKLRFEVIPNLWIPALLYEPETLSGKAPVSLNVNGHDKDGKAAKYKQIRCINQAKRGMLALNVEWFGMGQLHMDDFSHYRLNQIDLCGTSGVALFYLSLTRALDVLLSLDHADPERVIVSGLSGGGWQTIVIGALDTRVRLINAVAGYSSYSTRARFIPDMGDSEQSATDLGTIADFTHLTALMAPRPTLLTYNANDDCCFRADYALSPLLESALPVFQLYDKAQNLRHHVNHNPGTHNYEQDNREAFYRMVGDFFFGAKPEFKGQEIASDQEVKTAEQLRVALPADNLNFHSLALELSKDLPRSPALPADPASVAKWQRTARPQLRQIVRAKPLTVEAVPVRVEEQGSLKLTHWQLKMSKDWTVPAVELAQGAPQFTFVLVADQGRASLAADAQQLLNKGARVVAVDPYFFGEAKIPERGFLFSLLLNALGDRPLGLQASQLSAVARWLHHQRYSGPVTVVAKGARAGLCSLVAAALEIQAIGGLELHGSLGSLKEIIEQNLTAEQVPELFCFGLLETFDIKQLIALVAPRPVRVINPSQRAKQELADLNQWYSVNGANFEPLQ